MNHWRPAVVSLLLSLTACAGFGAPRRAGQEPDPNRIERDLGPVVIVEHRSPLAIDQTTVLARTPEFKALAEGVLKGVYPEKMGFSIDERSGLALALGVGPEYPVVKTIDEYVDGIVASDRAARARGDKRPFPPQDRAKLMADVKKDLGAHDILVLRYREKP